MSVAFTSFARAEVAFAPDIRGLASLDGLVCADPPPAPRPLRSRLLGRLLRRPRLPDDPRLVWQGLPAMTGCLTRGPEGPSVRPGVRVFDGPAALPAGAVVLVRPDHWERRVASLCRLGYRRFAVLPARDPRAGVRHAIVSRTRRFAFVPNYKVMYSAFRDFMRANLAEFRGRPDVTHALNEILDLQAWTSRRLFVFSLVRNPWDRLTSAYRDKFGRGPEHPNHAAYYEPVATLMGAQAVPFELLVRFCTLVPDSHINGHWLSQYVMLHAGAEPLARYVGRYEALADCLAVLRRETGIDWQPPHLNRTRGEDTDFRRYYRSDGVAEEAGRRYAGDARAFGYRF